jgi:hypothetical protein
MVMKHEILLKRLVAKTLEHQRILNEYQDAWREYNLVKYEGRCMEVEIEDEMDLIDESPLDVAAE